MSIHNCWTKFDGNYYRVDYYKTLWLHRCWCQLDTVKWMLVTWCWQSVDVDDENGQNRHQHLKVVANTFRLQHPSPISTIVIETAIVRTLGWSFWIFSFVIINFFITNSRFMFVIVYFKFFRISGTISFPVGRFIIPNRFNQIDHSHWNNVICIFSVTIGY